MNVPVAIAQTKCVDSDLEGNLARAAAAAEDAAACGARMVLFPETIDLGWVNPEAHRLAGPIPGPVTDRVAAMAERHGVWIGAGLCEKAGERLYDSSVLLDPGGSIVLKHRKINLLSGLMDPPYTPGDAADIDVAETPFGRVGMLICADSFREDLLSALAARSPDLVYVPYGWAQQKECWPGHGFELIKTVGRAARALGAPVLGPNLVGEITCGPWKGRTYEGLSTAADSGGLALVQGKWNEPDLLLVRVEVGT